MPIDAGRLRSSTLSALTLCWRKDRELLTPLTALKSAAAGCWRLAPGAQEGGCVTCHCRGLKPVTQRVPLLCSWPRGLEALEQRGTVLLKNFFFLWARAAPSEFWQDETSCLVSSRTSEARFPADWCPPFPLRSNLSFPAPSPPFSLAIPLTHFAVPRRVSSRARAACAWAGPGHCMWWRARTRCWLPS